MGVGRNLTQQEDPPKYEFCPAYVDAFPKYFVYLGLFLALIYSVMVPSAVVGLGSMFGELWGIIPLVGLGWSCVFWVFLVRFLWKRRSHRSYRMRA